MGRKNETTFPAAPAAIAKPSRVNPPTTAAQNLISTIAVLEIWTCTAPLDHPIRRAFVAAQAALYLEEDPFLFTAGWKRTTLRGMKALAKLPGSVLFEFCKAFLKEVEREVGPFVDELDPEVLGMTFSRACDRWRDQVDEFAAMKLPKGRRQSAVPELLCDLASLVRESRFFSDELRRKADRRVAEWAAGQTKDQVETVLREMRAARRGGINSH